MRASATPLWACVGLLWAQNLGIGTLTPTERLDVEGGRLRVRAYSGTGTRLATVDPTGVFGTLSGTGAGEVLTWNGTQWTGVPVRNGISLSPAPNSAIELGGPLVRNTEIDLNGQTLAFSTGSGGNVGIGTTSPAERLHVQGNLRLDGAFMPGGQAGAVGQALFSQGPGQPPVWQAIPTPPPPYCNNPIQRRFLTFSSTNPPLACHTTLEENANNQIWNAGDALPSPNIPFAEDKLSIFGNTTLPFPISGYTVEADAAGIYGQAQGLAYWSVLGATDMAGFGEAGAAGINITPTGIGVLGSSIGFSYFTLSAGAGGNFNGERFGTYTRASATTGDRAALVLRTAGTTAQNPIFVLPPNNPLVGWWWAGAVFNNTEYKIIGPGNVSTVVSSPGHFRDRVMFATEAPEILFMDFGTGQLQEGRAYIELDPIFANNIVVDERHPLRVYIQLEDDCEGVYVTNKSIRGFEVRELRGGRSNARFVWQVVANRKDDVAPWGETLSKHEGLRFPPSPPPLEEKQARPRTPDGFKRIEERLKSLRTN